MANLKRHIAPIDSDVWDFIDGEARRVLKTSLKGRKVVDFVGPKGANFAAVNTGRTISLGTVKQDGVRYSKRQVLPLIEIEIPFTLKMSEIDAFTRGAEDIDIDSLVDAAKKMAESEDTAIFFGVEQAELRGILEVSSQKPVPVTGNILPSVAIARKQLLAEGFEGPYNLILGPAFYSMLFDSDERGYPQKNRIESLIGGSIISAPILGKKGVLLPQDSADFEFISGQDISIGYSGQKEDILEFFMVESFTFKVHAPEASVILE